MDILVSQAGEVTRVALRGEFTIYAAGQKDELLAHCAAPDVVLDLAEVSDFDSVGVQLLLLLRRDAEKAARRLRLAAPSESVQGLLKLFGLFEYFPLCEEEGSLS